AEEIPMDALAAPFIFVGTTVALFLLIRKLQRRTNPLVKFGMKCDRTLIGVRFRKARFARFNLAPTVYCFYRHSLSYAVAGFFRLSSGKGLKAKEEQDRVCRKKRGCECGNWQSAGSRERLL